MNIQKVKKFQLLSQDYPMKKYKKKIPIDTDLAQNRVYKSQLSVSESHVAKKKEINESYVEEIKK